MEVLRPGEEAVARELVLVGWAMAVGTEVAVVEVEMVVVAKGFRPGLEEETEEEEVAVKAVERVEGCQRQSELHRQTKSERLGAIGS